MPYRNKPIRKTLSWECVHYVYPEELAFIKSEIPHVFFSKKSNANIEEIDFTPVVILEGNVSLVKTKMDLLDLIADLMKFPFFGQNWDALDDCLRDMSWMPAKSYVVILYGATELWKSMPDVVGIFVQCWLSSAYHHAEYSFIPFHLIFVM